MHSSKPDWHPLGVEMIEGDVELTVIDFARRKGWICRKVKWIGRNGAPDRVFGKDGRPQIWVEFKKPGKKPNLQQKREHKRLRAYGFNIYVIDNVEDGCALFT